MKPEPHLDHAICDYSHRLGGANGFSESSGAALRMKICDNAESDNRRSAGEGPA